MKIIYEFLKKVADFSHFRCLPIEGIFYLRTNLAISIRYISENCLRERKNITSCQDGTKRSDEALAESTDDSARQIQRYIRLTYLIPELLKMVDEGIVSLTAGENYSYLRQFEQMTVWMMLMDKSTSITTDKTEEMKNASKEGELNEEQIRGYFKCNVTEPKEKAPKKQSVKFAFDEISDFFPDMKPKEVKDKIIEILFAWYDAQQNAVINEPTELDNIIANGG